MYIPTRNHTLQVHCMLRFGLDIYIYITGNSSQRWSPGLYIKAM